MPKMKSHRGAAKRFKRTGSGKIVHKHQGMGHLLAHKSKKRKRRLKIMAVSSPGFAKHIDTLI